MDHCRRNVVDGPIPRWSIGGGPSSVVHRRWSIGDGLWSVVHRWRSIVSGLSSVVHRRWSIGDSPADNSSAVTISDGSSTVNVAAGRLTAGRRTAVVRRSATRQVGRGRSGSDRAPPGGWRRQLRRRVGGHGRLQSATGPVSDSTDSPCDSAPPPPAARHRPP